MNKIALALAMVATLGLSTAAFAENPAQRVQPAQSHAASHKMGMSHRVGAMKYVMAHRPHRNPLHHTYNSGAKNLAKHVTANKAVKTKTSS